MTQVKSSEEGHSPYRVETELAPATDDRIVGGDKGLGKQLLGMLAFGFPVVPCGNRNTRWSRLLGAQCKRSFLTVKVDHGDGLCVAHSALMNIMELVGCRQHGWST